MCSCGWQCSPADLEPVSSQTRQAHGVHPKLITRQVHEPGVLLLAAILQTYFGGLGQFEQAYIKLGGQINDCILSSSGSAHGDGDQLNIAQMPGLWIVLAMCVVACFALLLLHNIQRNPVQRQRALMVLSNVASMVRFSSTGGAIEQQHVKNSVPEPITPGFRNPANKSWLVLPLGSAIANVTSSLDSFTQHIHSMHIHGSPLEAGTPVGSPSKWRAFLGFTSTTG